MMLLSLFVWFPRCVDSRSEEVLESGFAMYNNELMCAPRHAVTHRRFTRTFDLAAGQMVGTLSDAFVDLPN